MQTITASQTAVADNPHGVDVRHLYTTPHVVVSQITLEPGEVVKPHKAPVDVFFYVLEGAPVVEIEGETVTAEPDTHRAERRRARARHPQRGRRPRAVPRGQDAEPEGLTREAAGGAPLRRPLALSSTRPRRRSG